MSLKKSLQMRQSKLFLTCPKHNEAKYRKAVLEKKVFRIKVILQRQW
jgi:hypothetical protein